MNHQKSSLNLIRTLFRFRKLSLHSSVGIVTAIVLLAAITTKVVFPYEQAFASSPTDPVVIVSPCSSPSAPCPSNSGSPKTFTDGRCNLDAAQTFAVYPDNKGGFYFYAVDHSVGTFAMHVSELTLDKNPDTGTNYIIAQSDGVQLWRLAGDGLEATRIGPDGKQYSYLITCGLIEDGD